MPPPRPDTKRWYTGSPAVRESGRRRATIRETASARSPRPTRSSGRFVTVTATLEDVLPLLDPPAIGVVTPDRFRRGQIVRSIRAMGGVPSGGNSSRTPTATVEAGNCSARRCRPTRAVRVGASSCRGATPAGFSRAGWSAAGARQYPVASTNRRRSRATRTKPSRPVAVTWQRHRTRPVPGRPPG